ncbi:MAG: hypothetical protein GDA36_11410, partial [Rhodobacteraceae bacterium]|nr:hypothetical protein [Paracoccaceae bacterium]
MRRGPWSLSVSRSCNNWLGLLLTLLFAVHLGWLPAMGARTPAHVIIPALTLGLAVVGGAGAHSPLWHPGGTRTARWCRVAIHAAIPVVTVSDLELVFLPEGAVMVKVIFSLPGLGSLLVGAIEARDFPKMQA